MSITDVKELLQAGFTASEIREMLADKKEEAPAEPEAAPEVKKEEEPEYGEGAYVIQSNDTLYGIAKAHGCTVADILSWNTIEDPDDIHTGDVIYLK